MHIDIVSYLLYKPNTLMSVTQPTYYTFTYHNERVDILQPFLTKNSAEIVNVIIDEGFQIFIESYELYDEYDNYNSLYNAVLNDSDLHTFVYDTMIKGRATVNTAFQTEASINVYDAECTPMKYKSHYILRHNINELLERKTKEYCDKYMSSE